MPSPADLMAQIVRSIFGAARQILHNNDNSQQISVALAMDALTKYKDRLQKRLSSLKDLDLTGQITHDAEARYLGGGAYGDIRIGKYCGADASTKIVAVKTLRMYLHEDPEGIKLFEREIRVWSKLEHANILPLLGYIVDSSGLPALISEFVENGTVLKYIKANPELDIVHMTRGIAEGISYLHNRIVIHSDIKSDNVLVSPGGDPLICDFGLSRLIVATHTMNAVTQSGTQRGSTRCMSPEIIEPPDGHVTYSEQSDIWAFGMTIYEILTRRKPFYRLGTELQVMVAITKDILPEKPELSQTWSSSQKFLWKICEACWQKDPSVQHLAAQLAKELRVFKEASVVTGKTETSKQEVGSTTVLENPTISSNNYSNLPSRSLVEWRMELNNLLQAMGTRDQFDIDFKQEGPSFDCTWTTIFTHKGTPVGSGSGNTKQQSIEMAAKQVMKSIFPEKHAELIARK